MVLIKNQTTSTINSLPNYGGELLFNSTLNRPIINTSNEFKFLVLSTLTGEVTGLSALTATQLTGTLQTAAQPNITSLGALTGLTLDGDLDVTTHNGTDAGLSLGGVLVTSTAEQLNYTDTTPGAAEAGKALVLDGDGSIVGISNIETDNLTVNGTLVTATALELNYTDVTTIGVAQASKAVILDADKSIVGLNNIETDNLTVNGTLVTSSAIELNYVDINTLGVAQASKALVLDANKDISEIRNLSADTLTGTLQTAAQPNITSLGDLTGLNVDGAVSVDSLTINGVSLTPYGVNGLRTRVYSTPDFNGRVLHTEITPTVDFTDYTPEGQSDDYSIEVWGYIKPLYSEDYTFTVTSNDHFRIWINNQLVRHGWTTGDHNALQTDPIALEANKWYPIYIQHVQETDNERLRLIWESTTQASQTVPTSAFAYDDKGFNVAPRTTYFQDSLSLYDSSNSHLTSLSVNSSGDLSLTSFSNNVNVVGHNGSTKGLQLNGTLVTATALELNYTDVTTIGVAQASKALIFDTNKDITSIRNITTVGSLGINTTTPGKQVEINSSTGDALRLTYNDSDGNASNKVDFTVSSDGNLTMLSSGLTTFIDVTNNFDVVGHNGTNLGLKLAGVLVTSTATELNYVDTTPGTAEASKALILDENLDISGINVLGADTLQVNNLEAGSFGVDTMNTTGNVGINTTDLAFGLQVNHATGDVLRLTYNDADGSATTQTDFQLTSGGTLNLTTSGTDGNINIVNHNGTDKGLQLNGVLITSTATQINYTDVTTIGTAEASKALVLDTNRDITNINHLTATTITGTLDTATQEGITTVGTLLGLSVSDVGQTINTTTQTAMLNITGTDTYLNGTDLQKALEISGSNASPILFDIQVHSRANTLSTNSAVLGTTTTNDLAFMTNNLTRMIIAADGKVGIGATPSTYGFEVGGSTNVGSLYIGGSQVTASADELSYLDITAPGTAQANKALVLDGNKDIATINHLTATTLTGLLDTAEQTNITLLGTQSALTVEGAVNVTGDSIFTGNLELTDALSLTSTEDATDSTHGGAFTSLGGGAFAKNVFIGDSLDITSDLAVGGNVVVTGPSLLLPTGNTASRPTPTVQGQVRYNTETNQFEGFGAGETWGSLGGVIDIDQDTYVSAENGAGTDDDNLRFFTAGNENVRITNLGLVGIGTNAPDKKLEINSATGDNLRLTYNDANGTAANKVDFTLSNSGNLTINSSGLTTFIHNSNSFDVASHNATDLGLKLAGVLLTATATELNVLDGITSSTAELNLLTGVTATTTELNYIDVTPGTATASKALVLDTNLDIATINHLTATTLTGTLDTAAQPNITSLGTLTGLTSDGIVNIASHDGSSAGLQLAGTLVTATATELNYVDVTTPGVVQLSKAVIVDESRNISNYNNISSTGTLGINTTTPGKQVEINSADGNNLRLTYNDSNGSATNYADFTMSSGGNLTMLSSGLTTFIHNTNNFDVAGHNGTDLGLKLAGVLVTSTAVELNYVDVTAIGTAEASKALVLDENLDISGINVLGADTLQVNNLEAGSFGVDTMTTTGNVGINTTDLTFGLQVNEADGNILRLTYADVDASPNTHTDFTLSSIGDLTVTTNGSAGSFDIANHDGTIGLKLAGTLVTSTAVELNYVDVTAIGTAEASKALILDANKDITNIRYLTADQLTGTLQTAAQPNVTSLGTLTGLTSNGVVNLAEHNGTDKGLQLAGTLVTATATELNYVDVTTPGTAQATKALVVDANRSIVNINNLAATTLSATIDNATGNTVEYPISITRTTSDDPANGLGAGIDFFIENSVNDAVSYGSVAVSALDITDGSEDGQLVVSLMTAGTTTTALTLTNTSLTVQELIESSDVRIKENFEEVDLAQTHDKLMQIKLTDYNYINDPEVTHRGLIAQELKEIIPSAVKISEKNGYDDFHSVSNKELVGYLIGTVQFLSKKIETLETRQCTCQCQCCNKE